MSELVEYKSHARILQIESLRSLVEKSVEKESTENPNIHLAVLMTTPPVYLPMYFSELGGEENFYQAVASNVKERAQKMFPLEVLSELLLVCSENNGTREIQLDNYFMSGAYRALSGAFKSRPQLLDDSLNQAREIGISNLLNLISSTRIPLMRYRIDIAKEKFNLSKTIDGGSVSFAPTAITDVDLKFWFSRDEKLPKLALRVSPFED